MNGEPDRDEIALLRDLAAAGAGGLRTASQWESWLRHAERFANLGFANTMLIWAQRPDAVLLHDYAGWKRLDRQVIRGAHGIRTISATRPERVITLFDLAQTEGQAIVVQGNTKKYGGMRSGTWEALTRLAFRAGFRVTATRAVDTPAIRWESNTIRATSGDAGSLARQVAHVLVHGDGRRCGQIGEKVEAESVAFLICSRLGLDTRGFEFPHVATWAGTDPRARPAVTVAQTGDRILAAAVRAFTCLDANAGADRKTVGGPRLATGAATVPRLAGPADDAMARIQREAARWFYFRMPRSWVPRYMASRGFGPEVLRRHGVGYAPGEWTALTSYLRQRGFPDEMIEASGLAKRSSRGTLFDVFRDRAMFPVRSVNGQVLGFIGRASPDAPKEVPKYLNGRETALYKKGHVLLGLYEGRDVLARGATPVITEGPMDAVAVTQAGHGRYVGVAPCGTALTRDQVSALVRAAPGCDRVIALFDGDQAGQRAAIKAFGALRYSVDRPMAAVLPPDHDPASFASSGADLAEFLSRKTVPLADLVVDSCLGRFDEIMHFVDGKFNALDAVAPLIAAMPPSEIARQVTRTAEHTGLTTAEVTTAVTRAVHQRVASDEMATGPPVIGSASPRRSSPPSARNRSRSRG